MGHHVFGHQTNSTPGRDEEKRRLLERKRRDRHDLRRDLGRSIEAQPPVVSHGRALPFVQEQDVVRERLQSDGFAFRESVPLGQQDDKAFIKQRFAPQARGIHWIARKSDVNPPAKHRIGLLVRHQIGRFNGHEWKLLRVMRTNAVDRLPESGSDAHLHEPDAFVPQLPCDAEQILARYDELLRLAQEPMARGRQHDARARPLEERDADFLLELTNMPTQGRLGDMESLRGPCEVQLLGDSNEGAQMAEIHRGRLCQIGIDMFPEDVLDNGGH